MISFKCDCTPSVFFQVFTKEREWLPQYDRVHLIFPFLQLIKTFETSLLEWVFFLKQIYLFFLAVLGLCCLAGFPLVAESRGYSWMLWWLLLLQSTGSRACGLNSCGFPALEDRLSSWDAWAQLLSTMWDPPNVGIKPMSPVSAGRFFATEPPGKPQNRYLLLFAHLPFHSRLHPSVFLASSSSVVIFITPLPLGCLSLLAKPVC